LRVKNAKDFYAGVLFMLVGSAFAWGALEFTVGTAARMGPGYFPLLQHATFELMELGRCE